MGPPPDEREAALEDERRRIRELRMVVDLTTSVLTQGRLSRTEAERLVEATRQRILELFPDKQSTYDLVLAPRFERLMAEFAGPDPPTARIIPFPKTE